MAKINRMFDIPHYQLEKFPNEKMFAWKEGDKWIAWSTKEFLNKAFEISSSLVAHGVAAKENVGLVSPNCATWDLLDIAIQQTGAVVVPVYPNISSSDYIHIFNDAKIKIAFVGNDELFEKINGLKDQIPTLQEVYHMDDKKAENYTTLLSKQNSASDDEVEKRKAAVKNEDLATIIYTSGTTGNPKGVMLSHNNIISNVLACRERIPADEKSRVLTFLPLCHSYERMLHYLYMYCGASVYFAESMDTIAENIREVKPHVFTAVPRLMEKVYDKIMLKGAELKGIKRSLFFWAVGLADTYSTEKTPSGWYGMKLKMARKLIFSKWQEALGGNVRAIASGSAALSPKLAQVFHAAGIPVLEGYGLTETSPVISVNCMKKGVRVGSVGVLIDQVKVKIAEDGEILVKGPNVMMGYYNLPDKTAEVMDAEGWFHTGDIGVIEDDKFLKIIDRKKEIFKTSGGKYIVPQMMENSYKESRFIEQIMVLGEGKNFPSALVVPALPFLRDWAKIKKNGLEDLPATELVKQPEVISRLHKEIEAINDRFGSWERVKKFALLPKEFSIEGGELTPTLKLKRKIILEKYKDIVDGFYD